MLKLLTWTENGGISFSEEAHWAQLCQQVWTSRNISANFQIKYLASDSSLSPYMYHVLKMRKNGVFDAGKWCFCFPKHCDYNARDETEKSTERSVLQLHYARSIKPHNIETMDCRLCTADCGQRIQSPRLREKNSSAHISIFQRFLKFPVAKREMSNSSSLNLALPCCTCQAWPLRGWGSGEEGNPIWKWRRECSSLS